MLKDYGRAASTMWAHFKNKGFVYCAFVKQASADMLRNAGDPRKNVSRSVVV